MGAIALVGKIALVVVNIATLLLSLAMIICGIIVVAGKDIYNSLLEKFKDELVAALAKMGLKVDVGDLTFTEVMLPLAYGVIGLGVIIGALSLLGCIGGCYSIKTVLVVYVIITTVFFVVQVAVVIVVYADKSAFSGTVKPRLKETLSNYTDIEGTNPQTLVWNSIMNYEGCCGVDSYKDFYKVKNWPPKTVGGKPVTLMTPVICCKVKSTDFKCAENGTANASNNWLETGCYDKLFDLVTTNAFVITVIAILFIFQLSMIIITILILCTMDNLLL